MKFGFFPIDDCEGVMLAHTFRAPPLVLKKGHVITHTDIAALKVSGATELMGARLAHDDIGEDVAAGRVAAFIAGSNVALSEARTGRCNLEAATDGVVLLNDAALAAANLVSETVTIATVPDKHAVKAGQIVATVKIIPFAVEHDTMSKVLVTLSTGAIQVAPFKLRRFVLISTLSAGLKPSVVEATEEITTRRVEELNGEVIATSRVPHVIPDVQQALQGALKKQPEVILIAGASATVDRNDVVPAAITAMGGVIEHFGMPVDPGNLLVLGRVGATPVLVLPGCARSPKLNGADWVMQRLAAGLLVTSKDIMTMGVGGLLVDIPSRPLPRSVAVKQPRAPRVGAIVLAAGQSRRMEGANKLLMPVKGELLVRRTVKAVRTSKVQQVVVVTGHQRENVEDAVSGLDVTLVHNPLFADGLSTSLKAGLRALSPDIDGVLICLGDMPAVATTHINDLVEAFDPESDRAIGVPTHNGKRGNPVLWARRFFEAMQEVAGDVGARHLIGANESLVYEIEFGDTGVLTDLDTPAQWQDYLSKPRA